MTHQEAADRNDLVNNLIECIESNGARYVLHLARIEYDEAGNPVNLQRLWISNDYRNINLYTDDTQYYRKACL